ncbi:H-2 class I histocompatibility antigen, alpha chain-like [Syngnathus scovelli]|uniref:H-2 class I histocompatibility antigen, alpha chain-like n=1 Tax=Syngnathus scovelli TaxID=161590 RepID=UPI00210FD0E5|nr:H-2 class I histocompatibility antigen, alpha chain-like [Syngnathus scovelli]
MGNQMNLKIMERNLATLKQRFNHTGTDIHSIQAIRGCEWDDDTNEIKGWDHYMYDGEDFLSFHAQERTWVAVHPQAFITKLTLDGTPDRNAALTVTLMEKCPFMLKKHVKNGKDHLKKTELPKVSLLQKTPSSPVTCHATGFYPSTSSLFWRRNGETVHDAKVGSILPNHDGTFQTTADLNVKVTSATERVYECVFKFDGGQEEIVVRLDAENILSNARNRDEHTAMAVAIPLVAVILLVLTVMLTRRCMMRQGNNTNGVCDVYGMVTEMDLYLLVGHTALANALMGGHERVLVCLVAPVTNAQTELFATLLQSVCMDQDIIMLTMPLPYDLDCIGLCYRLPHARRTPQRVVRRTRSWRR